MAGLVRPKAYPIRDVKSNQQDGAYCYNPRRYPDHGGLTGASAWPQKSPFSVEAPTKVRPAETSRRSLTE
jgi:hypothetical protein